MTVTKQTYAATPIWTAAGLANRFRDAFIDAGLMTDWHASFENAGIENRVLRIAYDSTKTYGVCFYWFQFTTSFAGISVVTGWNTSLNVPSGTQYNDFYSTASNTTANHFSIAGTLTTSTEIAIVRYTSGDNPDYSFFVLRNGATPFVFMIAPPSVPLVPWLDLNQTLFHHFVLVECEASPGGDASIARGHFRDVYRLRRSYADSLGARNETSVLSFTTSRRLIGYRCVGTGDASSDPSAHTVSVPYRIFRSTPANPPYASSYTPVIFSPSYSFYINEPLPADFAFYMPFTVTSFSYGDSVIITAGTEEWEVLKFANNSSADAGNPLFLARLV
jgi:hypothetical protein